MADDKAPTLDDRRTKATFDLFKELGCLRHGGDGEFTINDVGRLDIEKMMARALDCVAAVCEAQRVCVELGGAAHGDVRGVRPRNEEADVAVCEQGPGEARGVVLVK
jgi:hypothetical protein